MTQNGNPHSIYQPLAAVTQPGPIYVSNMATLRRQNVQMANVSLAAHHHQQQHLQQQHQQQQLQQQVKSPQESIEVPSSNSIDSAMYERDKQIYKCSTLRQGGKFDPKYKPSILNCPLPEIPKDESSPKHESIHQQQLKQQQHLQQQLQTQSYSKTLQRMPIKLPSHMKMIPPPRIETPTSPPQAKITTPMPQLINNGGTPQAQTTLIEDPTLPPPPPQSTQTTATTIVSAGSHTVVSKIANEMSMHIANSISSNNPITDDSDDLPPPPPPAITDESNYAVTEL